MAVKKPYVFTACKVAIFTWHGCVVQMNGTPQHAYVADETPMVSYLNLHHALDKLRAQAQTSGQSGPRVRLTLRVRMFHAAVAGPTRSLTHS